MPALRTKDTPVRSLEVTTTPSLPTLAIISPTPRAFTFPVNHNLEDSPYSTPSSSPFQQDLASPITTTFLPSTATPPPRTLSPTGSILSTPSSSSSSSSSAVATSPITGSSSSSLTHKRRKSSQSVDPIERRPKKGDDDYIKRPENAFILFRRKCCEERSNPDDSPSDPASSAPTNPPTNSSPQPKKQRQADLSKTISQQWKSLSVEERQYWEQLAKEKKKEHEMMYPNYVYRPQRSKSKAASSGSGAASATKASAKKGSSSSDDAGAKERGAKAGEDKDEERISFVVPLVPSQQQHLNTSSQTPTNTTGGGFYNSRPHGRSISAPTPPPPPFLFTQQISIPNLYTNTNNGGYTSNTTPNSPYLNQGSFGFGGVSRSMSLSEGMPGFPHAQALPTSPLSGVPMISGRRSSHPGYTNNTNVEQDQEFGFDSSEFLRGMYNMASTTSTTSSTTPTPAPVHHHHRQLSPLTLTTALSSSSNNNIPNGISPASSGPSSPLSAPYTPNSAYNNNNHNAYVNMGVSGSNGMYMMDANSANANANANANVLVHAFSQSSLEDGGFPVSSGVGVGVGGGYDMGVDVGMGMGMGMYGGDMTVGGGFEQELHEWGVGLNSMHLHPHHQQFPSHHLGFIDPSTHSNSTTTSSSSSSSFSAGYPSSFIASEDQYTKSHIGIGGGAFSVEMPSLFGGGEGEEDAGLLAGYEWENSPSSFHNLSPSTFNNNANNINGNGIDNGNAFMPDDFDISAIPPIEIGLPKFGGGGGGIGIGEGDERFDVNAGGVGGMEVDGTTTGTMEDASSVV